MQIGFEKTVYDDVTTPKPVCSKSKKNTIVHKKQVQVLILQWEF